MKERQSKYNLFRVLLLAGFLLGVALLVQTGSTYMYVYRNLVIDAAVREADSRNQSLQLNLRGVVLSRATADTATKHLDDMLEAWNNEGEGTQVAWIRIVDQKGETLASTGEVRPMPDLWSRVGKPIDERHSHPVLEGTDAGTALVEIYGITNFGFGGRRGGPNPAETPGPRSTGTNAGVDGGGPDRGRGPEPGGPRGPEGPDGQRGSDEFGRGPRGGFDNGQDPFRGGPRRGRGDGGLGGPGGPGGPGGGFDNGQDPFRGGPRRGPDGGPGGNNGPVEFGRPSRGGFDNGQNPFRGGGPAPPQNGETGRGDGPATTTQQAAVTPAQETGRGPQPPRGAGGNNRGAGRGAPAAPGVIVGTRPTYAVEIAIPLNSVSGPFASLRRTLIVGVGTSLALMASLALIALRLPHHLRSQQIEAQLALARRVQTDLLAPPFAVSPQIDFALECIPAGEVGGDFCDVFGVDNGRVALVLGDVSGKGISAALLMGLIHGAIHSVSWTDSAAAHENATRHLNELLCKKTARERFSSLFWGYFDPRESVLHYINAGHLPPLFIRRRSASDFTDFEVRRLDVGGTVLGLLSGVAFEQGHIPIQEGDLLVVFSDGLSEALNAQEEQFGESRMLSAIRECWDKSAEEIRDTAIARVQAFINNAPPNDDQTLIVARFQHLATRETRLLSTKREGIAV